MIPKDACSYSVYSIITSVHYWAIISRSYCKWHNVTRRHSKAKMWTYLVLATANIWAGSTKSTRLEYPGFWLGPKSQWLILIWVILQRSALVTLLQHTSNCRAALGLFLIQVNKFYHYEARSTGSSPDRQLTARYDLMTGKLIGKVSRTMSILNRVV